MRIELRGVKKTFGPVQVLRGVDFTLATGGRAALIGPNGSGKSTLSRAILGLIACEGEVRLDGRKPFEDRLVTARRVAYVPQVAPQISATVDELVATVTTTRGLSRAAVAAEASALALDLETVRGRAFRLLSGGMKQKLLIALALAAQPALYVLDEPTASLDAASRERFFARFAERAAGATVLLCSHRLEEIRQLTGQVLALDEGRVAYDGPAEGYTGVFGPEAEPLEALSRRVSPAGAPKSLLSNDGGLPCLPDCP